MYFYIKFIVKIRNNFDIANFKHSLLCSLREERLSTFSYLTFTFSRFQNHQLKQICELFRVDNSLNRDAIIKEVLHFLLNPKIDASRKRTKSVTKVTAHSH